jgi:hypothetical protein
MLWRERTRYGPAHACLSIVFFPRVRQSNQGHCCATAGTVVPWLEDTAAQKLKSKPELEHIVA